MTLHVRQSDRSQAQPTQWTPWGAMPATRQPSDHRRSADRRAQRQTATRPGDVRSVKRPDAVSIG